MLFEITLPKPHKHQRTIGRSKKPFIVAACGRRFGKTTIAERRVVPLVLAGRRVWWLAPSHKQTTATWRRMKRLLGQMPGIEVNNSERLMILPTGGELYMQTTGSGNTLRGAGIDYAVLDEAAFMEEDVWSALVEPMLLDSNGGAMFLSTPFGRNWFFDLYTRALADEEWDAFHFTTADNPRISPARLAAIKQSTPERIWREEYMAEFMEDSGSVFRLVAEHATVDPGEQPVPSDHYVFGVDWGRSVDYTAIVVMHAATRRVVDVDHFNQISWELQSTRLQALYDKWRPRVIHAESNSMSMMIEALQAKGLPVVPFDTNYQSKRRIIESLALAIETGHIELMKHPRMISELLAYEMERNAIGSFRYHAPAGKHDDLVIALALAYDALSEKKVIQFVEAPDTFTHWRG